ncbi:DUF4435 domain-containing protein [Chitinophaga sp. Cy-1792]|uniref:DUF4435 domain-containing protein n=1 Tax=Chitinophaga sp. Cy-1792 TaxID=2608339 RepID=UPI00141FFF5C|nr:DUF4435 domain-containing protein [Chitinophaga sp. Cy-1792]
MTADDLRKARENNPNVAYQTFIKHVGEDKKGYFYFIEGKDAPYYNLRVKNRLDKLQLFPIQCGGKSKVLKVYELIKNHEVYLKYKIGYFVDLDFDDRLNNDDIYETPTYSIENLYCYPEVMGEVLKNEFALSEVDEGYQNILKHYVKMLTEATAAQSLFNAWYYCLKEKKRNENLNTTGVALDDTFKKGYIFVDLLEIVRKYDLGRIRTDFKTAIDCDEKRINEIDAYFNSTDMVSCLRGKYLIEFFHKFLVLVSKDSVTDQKLSKAGLVCHVNLKTIISMYSQYAHTPACLINYLGKIPSE